VRLSDGNRTTTQALDGLGESARTKWIGRFRGLYQHGSIIRKFGNVTFAHAAISPTFWAGAALDKTMEDMAFFGEVDEEKSKGDRFVRSYRWVDSVPENEIAIVGHDKRSTLPYSEVNYLGGRAIFLDTGSGKGGLLSTACLRFTEGETEMSRAPLRFETMNIH